MTVLVIGPDSRVAAYLYPAEEPRTQLGWVLALARWAAVDWAWYSLTVWARAGAPGRREDAFRPARGRALWAQDIALGLLTVCAVALVVLDLHS